MASSRDSDYRVVLIDIAARIADAGVGGPTVRGQEDAWLERFRKAYQTMADIVEEPYSERPTHKFAQD